LRCCSDSAGELLTGCLQRFQRRQGQQHQNSEQRDQLQREVRNAFGSARRRYLVKLLQLLDEGGAGSSSFEGMTLKALEALVTDRADAALAAGGAADCSSASGNASGTGDGSSSESDDASGGDVRLSLAGAYLVVAHMWLIKQQVATAGGGSSRAVAVALGLGDDSDYDDSSEGGDDDGWGNWEPEEYNDAQQQQQQQQQHGWSKGEEVSRMVRLSFQWVVHRELAELAAAL
jgi:hypothetical protein